MPVSISAYTLGDQVRLSVVFTDDNGPADPTSVLCKVKDPEGAETTPSVARTDVGLYYADVTPDSEGRWKYRFEGTGVLVAADESEFFVTSTYL